MPIIIAPPDHRCKSCGKDSREVRFHQSNLLKDHPSDYCDNCKNRCRARTRVAIRKGEMKHASSQTCAHCHKRPAVSWHHQDYNIKNPFNVIPLCNTCHQLADKKNP